MESNICSPCSWEHTIGTDHEIQKSNPYPSHVPILIDPAWHYRSTQFPFMLIKKIAWKWMLDSLRKLSLINEALCWKKTNLNKSEIRVNVEKNSGNSIVTSIFVASIPVSSAGTVVKASAIHKTLRSSLGCQQTYDSKWRWHKRETSAVQTYRSQHHCTRNYESHSRTECSLLTCSF